jgi:uncharacterized protein
VTRLVATLFGAGFGFVLAWAQLTDPERIRQMLLLEDAHYYLMMATAFAVGGAATWLLRARRARTLTGELVRVEHPDLERRHVTGSLLFGLGWAITNACPGPIAAQLGQGLWWGLLTLVGFFVGARLHAELAVRRVVPAG